MTIYTAHSIDGDIPMTLEDLAAPGTDWSDESLILVTDGDGQTAAWIDPKNGMAEGHTPAMDSLIHSLTR